MWIFNDRSSTRSERIRGSGLTFRGGAVCPLVSDEERECEPWRREPRNDLARREGWLSLESRGMLLRVDCTITSLRRPSAGRSAIRETPVSWWHYYNAEPTLTRVQTPAHARIRISLPSSLSVCQPVSLSSELWRIRFALQRHPRCYPVVASYWRRRTRRAPACCSVVVVVVGDTDFVCLE